jgi:hypothetical protein
VYALSTQGTRAPQTCNYQQRQIQLGSAGSGKCLPVRARSSYGRTREQAWASRGLGRNSRGEVIDLTDEPKKTITDLARGRLVVTFEVSRLC